MTCPRALILAALLPACTGAFREHDGNHEVDGGPPPVTCGALTCDQEPASVCRDQDTLVSYGATCETDRCTYPENVTECGPVGCCDDHCCVLDVSNHGEVGTLAPTGLVISASGEFDTNTDCLPSSVLGACDVVSRPGLGEACVCKSDDLTIGTLKVKGSRALVLLVNRSVTVGTMLDVSGDREVPGPGASRAYANGPAGGAGGSFGTAGAGVSAATYGDADLVPLFGGMSGQWGGSGAGLGGGGGGALQISAGMRISVPGTINAGGGGGREGRETWITSDAGGGGSGGAVLLEAPVLSITGTITAEGGGGGGGGGASAPGTGGEGGGGVLGRAASGGAGRDGGGCPLYGYVAGGDGGRGSFGAAAALAGESSAYDDRCLGSPVFVGRGGAGGGGGRIRLNSSLGCQCSGTTTPAASFGTLVVH